MPLRRRTLAAAVALVATASSAHAQLSLDPAGVDLGVGLSFGGGGGLRHQRDGVSAAGTAAWRARALPGGALLVGVGASTNVVIGGADDCVLTPVGSCAADYPSFATFAALGGWELRGRHNGATVRVLGGGAVAHGGEGTALGLQARLDATTPAVARVALLGWGQTTFLPSFHSDSYRLTLVGIGLRIR